MKLFKMINILSQCARIMKFKQSTWVRKKCDSDRKQTVKIWLIRKFQFSNFINLTSWIIATRPRGQTILL